MLEESNEIEAELNLIKSKLKEFSKEQPSFSEEQLSNLSLSKIEHQLSEIHFKLNPQSGYSKESFSLILKEKDDIIENLRDKQFSLLIEIERLIDKASRAEFELACIHRKNNLACKEIEDLKSIISEFENEGKCELDFKIYSDFKIVTDENESLKHDLRKSKEREEELIARLAQAEGRYEETIKDLNEVKKAFPELEVNTADNLMIEFYRKLVIRLEIENKEIKNENEFFKLKNKELKKFREHDGGIGETRRDLWVDSLNLTYKKILELIDKNKEAKQDQIFVKKIRTIVGKITGQNMPFKDLVNYVLNVLKN